MFEPTSTNQHGGYRDTRCGAGQSAYDAIEEGTDDGWYPPKSTLGGRTGGDRPANAIARVTVRRGESYWIVYDPE